MFGALRWETDSAAARGNDALHQLIDARIAICSRPSIRTVGQLRPRVVLQGFRELSHIAPLTCQLDHSLEGRIIRASLGNWLQLRYAQELPDSFDTFLAHHGRANTLRKSMRKAAKAGISCSIISTGSDPADALTPFYSDCRLP